MGSQYESTDIERAILDSERGDGVHKRETEARGEAEKETESSHSLLK